MEAENVDNTVNGTSDKSEDDAEVLDAEEIESIKNSDESWTDCSDENGEVGPNQQEEMSTEEAFRRIAADNRLANRNIDEVDLPNTVTVLNGSGGEKVYLIGTAHFSVDSCEDVKKVIRNAQPDIVMIELCRGRTDLLSNDEKKLVELAGEVNMSKIMMQIKQKGVISGLMTFLLLHMSAHITKQLGMAPGSEFRTAYQEARRIPGCKVMFGDRAVEVTLQRAFATLSPWQKLKFAIHALKDLGPIKAEDIEKLKEKDLLEQVLGEMMEEFPQMTKVFLSERDIYLARSLQLAINSRVKTQNDEVPPVVVGVVGLGHAAGIATNFHREIDFDEMEKLMEVPKPSRWKGAFKIFAKLLLLTVLGFSVWKIGTATWHASSRAFGYISSGIQYLFTGSNNSEIERTDL